MRGDRALDAMFNPRTRPARGRVKAAAAVTLVPALLLGGLGLRLAAGALGQAEAAAWLAALVAVFLLSLPALGVLQADIRCNPGLPASSRDRWLALLILLPGAGGLYWLRHCRADPRNSLG